MSIRALPQDLINSLLPENAAYKADFSYDKNGLVYAYLQVSDLAFLARARPSSEKGKTLNELFIVNRKNGAPIQNAKVQFLDKKSKVFEHKKSDYQGHLTATLALLNFYSVRIEKGNDQLYLDDSQLRYYDYYNINTRESNKTYLFTDKPIYRPAAGVTQ